MENRGTFWPKKLSITREYLVDFKGRTCIVNEVNGWSEMRRVQFDGYEEVTYLVPLNEIYFSDHPAGYNQFN